MTQTIRSRLREAMREKLIALYGATQADETLERIAQIVARFPNPAQPRDLALSERDALIIAYGDHVQRANEAPLVTLHDTLKALGLPIPGLHILPFYPYSSDDGFSVIDPYQVAPSLGDWANVRALCGEFRVMFDAVFNHISAHSEWFKAFLLDEPPYNRFFITVDPATDLSQVTRPRALPLLTPFYTAGGRVYVWTTFSDDQIDLNFANPAVLVAALEILAFFIEQGAQLIRLDAIAFLWKTVGTTCIHLPETHLIIQLMRDLLDEIAPQTILITETNVPQQENLSYFGDGTNEAQLVYQFPLPPLILHTLASEDATHLNEWAATIERASDQTTFFNFTASHDGIGLRPLVGLLNNAEIAALVKRTEAHGGFVSYKANADGTQSPYELNITYFDAITPPDVIARTPQVAIDRFIVSQAIMLAFIGVPGIYFPSLFGSRNNRAEAVTTGRYRTINREKLKADDLLAKLTDPAALHAQVLKHYRRLLEVRTRERAFHPLGMQRVLRLDPRVFALERTSPDAMERVITLHNISGEAVEVTLPLDSPMIDLIDGGFFGAGTPIRLNPYEVLWLKGA